MPLPLTPENPVSIVSIIMPVFNASEVLPRAVESVLAQQYTNWELLLIDDGSADGSAAIIAAFADQDDRIHGLYQPLNSGAAEARNVGIRAAQGRYIAFLDADDTWTPDKLNRQITFMQDHGVPFCYSGFWRKNGDDCHRVRVPQSVTHQQLLRGNIIGCLTAIYDRDYFGTVEMPLMPLSHDYALWLDLLSRGKAAGGIDLPLATYHRMPGSLSSSRKKAIWATWQLYRKHQGLSRIEAGWCLTNHLLRRLLRG